jgi:lysozyme family protein
MSNFNTALNLILKHEGGYANNPLDRGGETYQGIARNYNASWAGWAILDNIANKTWNAVYSQLDYHVEAFYKSQYWDRHKLGGIQSQAIANLVFDWLVNSGQAGRQIQQVLVSMGQNIVVDNVIGQQTVNAINAVNQAELNNKIVSARVAYYQSGVYEGWLDSSFLNGLISRAESFAGGVIETVGKSQSNMG